MQDFVTSFKHAIYKDDFLSPANKYKKLQI